MAQSTVLKIFTERNFSIPHYQRDYAWNEKNLEDLWEDLLEAHENSNDAKGHFLGTIVTAPNPENQAIYDIIDGQQRSTTIFMLRFALNQKTENPDFNRNHFFDENNELRLQVARENKDFFRKIIDQAGKPKIDATLENECKTKAQKNLFNVFKAILKHVSLKTSEEAKGLLKTLNTMIILELEEENPGRAIRLFQTVNDRGVDLGILDKLKALLILYSNKFCDGRLDEKINENFGELFKTIEKISNSKVASVLSNSAFEKEAEKRVFDYHARCYRELGHFKYSADETYSTLKAHLRSMKDEGGDIEAWLNDYSLDLLEFTKTFLRLIEETETNIELFKLFFILKINPFLYPSLVRLKMNGILDQECLRLIGQADIIFYKLDSTNDSRAYNLHQTVHNKEEFKRKIIQDSASCAKGRHKYLKEALEAKINTSYEWLAFNYLFFTYYRQYIDINDCWNILGDKKVFDFITQEHIVPQNADENGTLDQYGFANKTEFDNLKHTFGNLISLEKYLNSRASDNGPAKKREIYGDSKIPYNGVLAASPDFLSFGKDQIIKRNEEVLKWLTEDFFADFL